MRKEKPKEVANEPLGTQKVFINVPPPPHMFKTNGSPKQQFTLNAIATSKYTVVNFLPKNLFEQFKRIANLYFLGLTILQFFPAYSTINPFVSALPLLVIVGLQAIKDGFEDWKRHQSDKEMNSTVTHRSSAIRNINSVFLAKSWWTTLWTYSPLKCSKVLPVADDEHSVEAGASRWIPTPWADIQTGDILILRNNESVPADVVILATSEPSGLCYIETKNLDGETNLKIRKGITETEWIEEAEDCANLRGWVESEKPNGDLYTFLGTMALCDESGNVTTQVPLNISSLLLRGSSLRNTDWVIGLTLHTGNETKIRRNAGKTPSKRSQAESRMNIQVVLNLLLLLIICIVTCVANPIWELKVHKSLPPWLDLTYMKTGFNVGGLTLDAFCIIIYQNVVPLSLYITLEIVKTMQAYFIYEDVEMYHAETDSRCIPRNWAIADDLGKIDYIFSDKTGTLTRNVMEFKRLSAGGNVYCLRDETVDNPPNSEISYELQRAMAEEDSIAGKCLYRFFKCLALCHTVLCTRAPDGTVAYNAQSPDESALVDGAKAMQFEFSARESSSIDVIIRGQSQTFELLNVIEFNSDRKRMSVVIKDGDEIIVYCKGADSVIWERLRAEEEEMAEVVGHHLEEFAEEGLRTLCIAQRTISQELYDKFSMEFQNASTSMENREEKIDKAAELIECQLELLGATAIEDKLQEGVPECISVLLDAGMKLWVLTGINLLTIGDKMETAINIGFSSNLLVKDMELILIRGELETESASMSMKGLPRLPTKTPPLPYPPSLSPNEPAPPPLEADMHALIIDGQALKKAFESPAHRATFLSLATQCTSVICCRVSPLQKAQIVSLVKATGAICLSIGDGANDVSMIQAAHIGIGISGKEGLQASMAADYAIAQFKYLERLCLVHGRWSFQRITSLILCFFVKNVIWVLVLFWFQIFSGWSAQSVYDFTYTLLYNIVFTGLPVIVLGVFDQDLSPDTILAYAPVYRSGTEWRFSMWRFAIYMLDAAWQSLVIFFMSYWAINDMSTNWPGNGRGINIEVLGCMTAVYGVINTNLVVAICTHSFTWIHVILYTLSEIVVVCWTILYSYFPESTLWGVSEELFSSPTFWLCGILVTILCQAPRVLGRFLYRMFWPGDLEIVQEI
ncbi:hypothetical protein DFS34DRAFT_578556, partial [Phlyctochytrium arcticum]